MKPRNPAKVFHFKQFSITQDGCGMPVSTDGVLLGSWFSADKAERILDIGTGTGLVALMAAQRFPDATIDAIDINSEAIRAAQYNITQSPWHQRIQLQQTDVLNPNFVTDYDVVVCNPPYFTSGETAQNQARATARHTVSLTHENLIDRCSGLLNVCGRASFILPFNEGTAMIEYALTLGWFLSRYCAVRPTPAKPVSRLLFELSKEKTEPEAKQELTIQQQGKYSDEFVQLTQPFYLKM